MADDRRMAPGELRKLLGYDTELNRKPMSVTGPAQEALRDAELRLYCDKLLAGLGIPRHMVDDGPLPAGLDAAVQRLAAQSVLDSFTVTPTPSADPKARALYERWKRVWSEVEATREATRPHSESIMKNTEGEAAMSESDVTTTGRNMTLEEELAAHEARIEELKAEINKKKGVLGHPTAVMLQGGVVQGTKLLAATEAVDLVEALARKVALKFFIPEGHEGLLDTPQGKAFLDLSMPIALHLAASHRLFGPGSEFVAATGEYAFVGNWFKHGKGMTTKMREVMSEFAGELTQLKELGRELMGLGQSDNLLSDVADFATKSEELSKVKAEARG